MSQNRSGDILPEVDRGNWLETRLSELGDIFAVAVGGFAVVDNHLHVLAPSIPGQPRRQGPGSLFRETLIAAKELSAVGRLQMTAYHLTSAVSWDIDDRKPSRFRAPRCAASALDTMTLYSPANDAFFPWLKASDTVMFRQPSTFPRAVNSRASIRRRLGGLIRGYPRRGFPSATRFSTMNFR